MTVLVSKIVWCLGVIVWFAIRYPFARRARRVAKVRNPYRLREFVLMSISAAGLGIVPGLYVFTDVLRVADYPIQIWQPVLGAALFAGALYLFRRTHKDLGRNWSVTLEVREQHALVTEGIYKSVRHPMYSAFWLWAVAQAVLLPNWVAGFAGIAGFGTLFFLRVGKEEAMMLATFGDSYRSYMQRTWRVLPGVF
jgi:protein-S-isoprenylcysteine O-methyltransferase Ste14